MNTKSVNAVKLEQVKFRLEHKQLCLERAIDNCRYDDANIFSAQIDYIKREIKRLALPKCTHGIPMNIPCYDCLKPEGVNNERSR
jgi:hypothetical protein